MKIYQLDFYDYKDLSHNLYNTRYFKNKQDIIALLQKDNYKKVIDSYDIDDKEYQAEIWQKNRN